VKIELSDDVRRRLRVRNRHTVNRCLGSLSAIAALV
jgi:hypothetical protein